MNSLYFTVGLPRSGKSTCCKDFLDTFDNIAIVCADDIRLAMGHRWNPFVEPMVNAIKLTMIRTLLYKQDVIVDGTHTTKKSIMELLRINHMARPIYMKTSAEECKKRAIDSKQEDLIPVIERMDRQLKEWKQSDINEFWREEALKTNFEIRD